MTRFEHHDKLPRGFLDISARDLHRVLPRPALIDLPGEAGTTLFVSVLQHGNEYSGLCAVQRLLKDYEGRTLPRPMSLFVANPGAARAARRRLDDEPDLNRSWPGTDSEPNATTAMLAGVVAAVHDRPLFASVDIHNTSGRNPVYAGINVIDATNLQLASHFSRHVVYFTRPLGLQAQAFLGLCPSVILECGRPGDEVGIEAARGFLEHLLAVEELPATPPEPDHLDLLRSVALVKIRPDVHFAFGPDADADLELEPEIDLFNFHELAAGTVLGRVRGHHMPVDVVDSSGFEVTESFFELHGRELRLRRAAIPSLFTLDPRIVRQDCLCHLMEPFEPENRSAA